VGGWKENNSATSITITKPILYFGGYTVPRDAPGYIEGESLSMSSEGDTTVLSFGVCVLGCWTCLIIIEQVIAYQRKGSQIAVHDHCSRYRSYQWLLLSAIALGSCAIWGVTMIGISAVDVGTLTTLFDPFTSIMALIYVIVLSYLALWLQWKSSSRLRASFVTPILTPPRSISGTAVPRVKVIQISTRESCERAIKHITPISILSSFVYTCAIWGVHHIGYAGVRISASSSRQGGIEMASFLFSWFCSLPPLVAFFHAEQQVWRITAAFALALITFATHAIHTLALSWRYQSSLQPSNNEMSSLWLDVTINLLVSVLAAVLCFLFIGINVSSLKLRYTLLTAVIAKLHYCRISYVVYSLVCSRNILDRLLMQMQKQMTKLEDNLLAEKKLVRTATIDAGNITSQLIYFCVGQ
jgi:hypothetical protein